MIRAFAIALALLLAAPAAWAVVACDIYTRSSDGNDSDNGTTWALANATLVGSITDASAGQIICVEDGHNETQSTNMTLLPTGDTEANPYIIVSVSDADDSYSRGSSCQVSVTGANTDIFFDGHIVTRGVHYCSEDDIYFNYNADATTRVFDTDLTQSGGGSRLYMNFNPDRGFVVWKGGTINFSHANGGFLLADDQNRIDMEGITFSGNASSTGLFGHHSGSGALGYRCVGCDFSAYSGDILVDMSTSSDSSFEVDLVGSLLPASVTIHDSGFTSPSNQYIFITGTDDATGNEGFRQELYTFNGDVTTDTTVYHDNGPAFAEGSTKASMKFAPASHVSEHEPLCSWMSYEKVDSTGSKTWTTEIVENFTSALTLAEVWQEIFYLGTTSSPEWTLDLGQAIGSTTALTAGVGLASWTAEPAGSRSAKLTTTATVNKTGMWGSRVCVGAYEASKVVHAEVIPTVS